jgi:hypothetical protein
MKKLAIIFLVIVLSGCKAEKKHEVVIQPVPVLTCRQLCDSVLDCNDPDMTKRQRDYIKLTKLCPEMAQQLMAKIRKDCNDLIAIYGI